MKTEAWNDQYIEERIGYLLISGVLLSALLVLVGGIVFLLRHGNEIADYHAFHGEPAAFRTVRGMLAIETLRQGRGLIQLGLVLLIFTPIARVAFAIVGFAKESDRMYVAISLIVLAVLLYSFTSA